MLIYESDGLVGNKICMELAWRYVDLWSRRELKMPAARDDCLIKTALRRMILRTSAKVPLAEHSGCVTGTLNYLGNRCQLQRQADCIHRRYHLAISILTSFERAHAVDSRAGSILSGHQCRPRRCAVLADIITAELHSLLSQSVDVGRFVVAGAHASEVGPSQVICHDEDDVRSIASRMISAEAIAVG